METKIIKFKDITKLKQWKNLPIKELKADGYPVYGANGIIGYYDEYNHEFPTLAITCRGATCGNIHLTQPKSYITSNAMALDDLDTTKIDLDYLRLILQYRGFDDVITGAAQPQITRRNLEKIKLTVPKSIDDQIKIANLLSQVEALIAKREESINLLDELLRSTFLDMFGDPVLNTKKIKKLSIDDFTNAETGATPSRQNEELYYNNGSIPWVKTTEVKGKYIYDTEEKITQKAIHESNCKVFPKDTLLIAMYGQGKTRGRVAYLKIDASTNQACAAIIPNTEYSSIFLFYQLQYMYKKLRSMGRGGGQPNLNLSIIKKFKVISPLYEDTKNIKLFEKIVQQVEESKKRYQDSLNQLHQLFGSLSQRAFKGELDLSRMGIEDDWTKQALAKQKAYEEATQTKVYESGMDSIQTVSIKHIPKENIKDYLLSLIKLNTFDIDDISHHIGTDFTFDELKQELFNLLNERKIKQIFDEESKKIRFKVGL